MAPSTASSLLLNIISLRPIWSAGSLFWFCCCCLAMATVAASSSISSHASRRLPNLEITKPLRSSCFTPPKTLINLEGRRPFCFSSIAHPRLGVQIASTSSSSSASVSLNLKSRLRNGDTLYGIFLLSFSPTLAEICGLAGYDFVVVDMEHGPGGISDALHCLRALSSTGTPAILRLPESSPIWAKKALDLGPQGIMLPMIDSPKQAKEAVSYCKFPPGGVRGSAHTVVRASNYGIDAGYLSRYEEELLIMCQVESEEGVKKIEEIAAVDGVDCIQMGPLDLSASMGYLWEPGHHKVKQMMNVAEKAVLGSKSKDGNGAYLSGFAMPHDSPHDLRLRGYHMISGAVDVGLFRSCAIEDVNKFKISLSESSQDEDEDDREDSKEGDKKYWSE